MSHDEPQPRARAHRPGLPVAERLLRRVHGRGAGSSDEHAASHERCAELGSPSQSMVFGRAALVPRCQIHKTRNILDHLPERQRSWVLAILKRAYQSKDVKTATRLLRHLARRLDQEHPCAAASVREGLEETVTVLTLGLSPRLQRSLATTNDAESLISRIRHVSGDHNMLGSPE